MLGLMINFIEDALSELEAGEKKENQYEKIKENKNETQKTTAIHLESQYTG